MNTIEQTLRAAAAHGGLNLEKAIKALAPFDSERAATVDLLQKAETQVGMMLGEDIKGHVAKMTGGYFNAQEYQYERLPGEQ